MEKRPRSFTAEKRIAEFTGAPIEVTGAPIEVTNDDLMDAFHDLSAIVQEVAGRMAENVPDPKEEAPPPPAAPTPDLAPDLAEAMSKREIERLKGQIVMLEDKTKFKQREFASQLRSFLETES